MEYDGLVTSELLWRSALVTALIDTLLVAVIGRLVSSDLLRKLKWHLAAAALLVFAILWGTFASVYFWDAVYRYVFPAWSRWLLPVVFGVLNGALALIFWRVSLAAARWQPVWFFLLGGVESLIGHALGISRGLMRVPMLSDASAASALVFGVFEYVFYWCVIVGLAVAAWTLGLRAQPRRLTGD